ncbi:MAG: hypothetical protein H6Q25_120 [Bacteroidetes bacterium]|nr:hypothetical protein [Bacteroidota bacterium]
MKNKIKHFILIYISLFLGLNTFAQIEIDSNINNINVDFSFEQQIEELNKPEIISDPPECHLCIINEENSTPIIDATDEMISKTGSIIAIIQFDTNLIKNRIYIPVSISIESIYSIESNIHILIYSKNNILSLSNENLQRNIEKRIKKNQAKLLKIVQKWKFVPTYKVNDEYCDPQTDSYWLILPVEFK